MKKECFVGIDLGTTSCKVLVVDSEGEEISAASAEYSVHQPKPSWQELELDQVWNGMVFALNQALKGIDKKSILAIGFSSLMHGFMPVGKKQEPLGGMLTWADGRAQREAERLKEMLNEKEIYKRTGCPLTALYYPARILWLKQNQPRLFARTAKFVSIKDAIIFRLTGKWVIDKSQASSNGLLNIHQLVWDKKILSAIGIEPEKLPELVEPEAIVEGLSAKAGKDIGLAPGIPVIAGAGDGGLANLGSGAVELDQVAVTIGTSGAVRKVLKKPWLNPNQSTWLYYLADKRWYTGGAINSGGAVLRWLRDSLFSDLRDQARLKKKEPYTELIKLAMSVAPGADGLVFLPYLFGERTPYWNPEARGVFFGIAPHHTKAHFARAVLEGITMAIAHLVSLLKDAPGEIQEIRASGGFVKSELWVRLLADIIGKPVAVPKIQQGSAMGAALLAMLGAGKLKNLSEAQPMIPLDKKFEPELKLRNFYQEQFQLFLTLYQHLEQDFSWLAKMRFSKKGKL